MSEITPIHKGVIEHGKAKLLYPQYYHDWVAKFTEGADVDVIVRKHKKQRSIPQNNYLWGVVYKLISDYTGMTVEEVHEHCKWKFLRKRVKRLHTTKSTTNLSTLEFNEYIDKIVFWAGEKLECFIPSPNSVEY